MQRWMNGGASVVAILLLVPVVAAGNWVTLQADGSLQWSATGPAQGAQVLVHGFDDQGISLSCELRALQLELIQAGEQPLVELTCPDEPLAGVAGGPALPVVRRMIATRPGATVTATVRTAAPVTLDLAKSGIAAPVQPMAAYYSTMRDPNYVPQYDAGAYARAAASAPDERVRITPVGIVRGYALQLVELRPVACDAAGNTLLVWPQMDVELSFAGGAEDAATVSRPAHLQGVVLNPPFDGGRDKARSQNYLIIAAPDFVGCAPLVQFVNAKTAQGYTVSVYAPPVGTTVGQIKTYIQSLWGTASEPDYILIVARGDIDTTVKTNVIGTYHATNPRDMHTDIPLVCMDGPGDWQPDIPIARFSVISAEQLQSVVDKTLYVEAGNYADPSYTRRAVFIASGESDAGAEPRQDYMINKYMVPNRIDVNKIYVASHGDGPDQLRDAVNAGTFLVTYFGHAGGFQSWASPVWGFPEIEALTNTNAYPLVVSLSCSPAQYYLAHYLSNPGLLEKWVLVPNKGAVAGYGPVVWQSPYTWVDWEHMYDFFLEAIYTNGTRELGPAYQAAARRLVTFYGPDEPISLDYTEEFYLLGDPTLQMPSPPPENYLLIVPPSYAGTAPINQLVAHRQSKGLNVITYTPPAGTTRDTIKAYIKSLWATTDRPSYILIAADTSGTGTSSATGIPHWTGGGSKAAATDLPYACMGTGDDWYPEIAIGRFPVANLTQLQAMVSKTVYVESGTADPNALRRIAFSVNSDTYSTGENTANAVISTYLQPNAYEGMPIFASAGGTTQHVRNAVNNGCLILTYMGHSGTGGWWEPAFNQSDVQGLTNANKYPLVLGWSCSTSHFEYTDEVYGETWVRQANKGAVAYISASQYIYWGSTEAWRPSGILEKAFFAALFEDDLWRVGPAWQAGLYRFCNEFGLPATPGGLPTQNLDIIRNFFEEFVLFGDPALQLPQPDGFRLEPTPAARQVCIPSENATLFSIVGRRFGSFAEPVTVSVDGLPAGATAAFSTNDVAPPFTTTLTVGNLPNVAAGTYNLIIRGHSVSKDEQASVLLTVSSQIPAPPSPTSPANDATGISRTPTFVWTTGAQTAESYVEVSTSSTFTTLAFSATLTDKTITLTAELNPSQMYFWRVRGSNGCGSSEFSTVWHFTTVTQRDYFTESFGTGQTFDLGNRTLCYIPDGSANYYRLCGPTATALPTDPSGGTVLTLSDDGNQPVTLTTPVKLYGATYSTIYVNSNGNITFNSGDGTSSETLTAHFSRARVAPLFNDFNPAAGGQVSVKKLTDRVAVTWLNVPHWNTGGQNTFQVEMFYNGEIHITYLTLSETDGIAGLSNGGGTPSDFAESNLSNAAACAQPSACCSGRTCTLLYESECVTTGGIFMGNGTDCEPNPCLPYRPGCVIISEVVQGAESGDCPRFIELTNTGVDDFAFFEGGLIVQTATSSDLTIDVDLTNVVIPAGESFVIASNAAGACTGAFPAIFGQDADLYTNAAFGYGDDRLILTDRNDASRILDMYGEFGVDGTGHPWEYTKSYAYRLAGCTCGFGRSFDPAEWFFGGVNGLAGLNSTELLLTLTTPGTHISSGACAGWRGDVDGDGDIDANDLSLLRPCLLGPDVAPHSECSAAQLDLDGDTDLHDLAELQLMATGSQP